MFWGVFMYLLEYVFVFGIDVEFEVVIWVGYGVVDCLWVFVCCV